MTIDDGGPVHPPTMAYDAGLGHMTDSEYRWTNIPGETAWQTYMRAAIPRAMDQPDDFGPDRGDPDHIAHLASRIADAAVVEQRLRWPLKKETSNGGN